MLQIWIKRRPRRRSGWSSLTKYRALFWVSVRHNFAYLGEVFSRILLLSLLLFILSQLWQAVYHNGGGPTLAGFSLNEMIWYITITEVFVNTRPNFFTDIDNEVRSGELAYTLGRPYNYLCYQLAIYLGARLVKLLVSVMVAAVIITLLAGAPTFIRFENLMGGGWLILLAMVVDFLAVFLLAIQSFWAEDTSAFILLYTRLVMLLGGMLIPLDLLPEPLATLTKALPFSYILYLPARLTIKFEWDLLAEASLKLGVTIAVLGALALFVLKRVERRLSTNGG